MIRKDLPTPHEIKAMLDRVKIARVRNRRDSGSEFDHRLLGVEQALEWVRGEANYIEHWLASYGSQGSDS